MYKRKKDYLLRTIMSISLLSKHFIDTEPQDEAEITEDDIELVVYSFLIHERNKMPKLKSKDERYIIFRVHGELFIVTEFSPFYMLQYVDKIMVTREYIINGDIESEATDEFLEPELKDISDKHIVKWLFDNQHIWAKEDVQCLRRA